MENIELTIVVGTAILIYKRVEITVWQKDLDSPFSFEFALDGKSNPPKDADHSASPWLVTLALELIMNSRSVDAIGPSHKKPAPGSEAGEVVV